MPDDWLSLTTHRLDVYKEKLAKVEFLEHFESLFHKEESNASLWDTDVLHSLPTAYDYIRLGHPLSCILEWTIAKIHDVNASNVISFSSQTMPVLAIFRKNLLADKNTQILYTDSLPAYFDEDILRDIYGYKFEVKKVENFTTTSEFEGSTVCLSQHTDLDTFELGASVDFLVTSFGSLGSVLTINKQNSQDYISDIQHVRRRETIAMTPADCLTLLNLLITYSIDEIPTGVNPSEDQRSVVNSLMTITGAPTRPLIASSGLSIQYAIVMGLIHYARENYAGKEIKIVVPPNCYGGTNDQAQRVAACFPDVQIVDLPVDGDNDMVQSIDRVLAETAQADAVPFIIAEIPTNPRVEVPDLAQLKAVLEKERMTTDGQTAIRPVFILDQTFCPNVQFLSTNQLLTGVKTISYVSGSKFPSGGKCTAGYCVGNEKAKVLFEKIALHLKLCDNEATNQQLQRLAEQLPTMNQRIRKAYDNTRQFVDFLYETLPNAKINFVSEELAEQGFTPSVFSLSLPTKGATDKEKESYRKNLNLKLINLMLKELPDSCKYCVSYGQLKGSYWTIPATSTQGTTKEKDKDYIVRASFSPDMDLEEHKRAFSLFVRDLTDVT